VKTIPDKCGNSITVGSDEGNLIVTLNESLILGEILPKEKLFIINGNEYPVKVSDKFLSEAKTFNTVQLCGFRIGLNSLLYNLYLPKGIIIDSFAKLSVIEDFEGLLQFKNKYEAMLTMTNIYVAYFLNHPGPEKFKLNDHTFVTDTHKLVETCVRTIQNYASAKRGGEPAFLLLTEYYRYLKEYEAKDS